MIKCIAFCIAIIRWLVKSSVCMEDLENDIPAFFNDYVMMESYECFQPDRMNTPKTIASPTGPALKSCFKGLAYAMLPRLMAYDDIYVNAGMIIPVPLSDADVSLTTYIAYSSL